METSDDPFITPAVIGQAVLGAGIGVGVTALTGGFKRSKDPGSFRTQPTAQAKQTAEPILTLSEQAKRNKRLAASALTREFKEPTLGIEGLVGL